MPIRSVTAPPGIAIWDATSSQTDPAPTGRLSSCKVIYFNPTGNAGISASAADLTSWNIYVRNENLVNPNHPDGGFLISLTGLTSFVSTRNFTFLTMKRNSGFTLIEVMVAMLLGAIGLLGTLAVQQAVIGASKMANDAAIALRLASQKLEEFSTVLTTGAPTSGKYDPAQRGPVPVARRHCQPDRRHSMETGECRLCECRGHERTTGPTAEFDGSGGGG